MDKPENCISVAKAKAMEASWEATRGLEPKISIFLGVYEKTENRPPVSTFFLAPIKPVQIDGVVKDLPNYEIDPYNLGEVPWPLDKYGTE